MRIFLPIVLGCSLAATSALAQTTPTPQERRAAAMQFIYSTMGYRADTIEKLIRQSRMRFEQLDVDGGGYGESDIRLADEKARARTMASYINRWLQHDLNGDGKLTEQEINRSLLSRARQPLRSAAGQVMPTDEQIAELLEALRSSSAPKDPNNDGTITLDEMLAEAQRRSGGATFSTSIRLGNRRRSNLIPEILDANGDGAVTWAEIEREIRPIMKEFDTDQDGELSIAEMRALRNEGFRLRNRSRTRPSPFGNRTPVAPAMQCDMARAREGMELVALRIFGGKAVPTVSLGGDNVVTGLSDLVIEEGKKPVFLVVAVANPMILRLSGAVDRVQRVVAVGPFVAFTGIDRARVSWTHSGQCGVPSWNPRDNRRNDWDGILEKGAGRKPDRDLIIWNAGRIALPEGRETAKGPFPGAVTPDLAGAAGPIWKAFQVFAPGGLVHIRPADVISASPASRYSVLPHLAGLATLVESGSLALKDAGEIGDVKVPSPDGCLKLGQSEFCVSTRTQYYTFSGKTYRSGAGGVMVAGRLPTFEIKAALRLPPGLRGAHAADFELPAGMPRPTGWLGNSRLIAK